MILNKLLCFMLAISIMITSTRVVYASDASNLFQTGGIQVKQDVYQMKDGKRVRIDHSKFYIGQTMSYVVDITNKMNASYVRVYARIILDGEDLPNNYLVGIPDTWIQKGEYWYNIVPMQKKEKNNFCTGIFLPDSLSGKTLDIVTRVEAIQEYGFKPDFNSDEPFEGILIEDTKVSGDASTPDVVENGITFDDSLSAMIDNKDFLSGIGEIMPGQQVSDEFKVSNSSKRVIKLKLVADDNYTARPNLYNIELDIERDDTLIYDGLLHDEVFKEGLVLGTFDNEEESTFKFTISAPIELTNSDAKKASSVAWHFNSEVVAPSQGNEGGGDEDDSQSETTPSTEDTEKPDGSIPSRPDESSPNKPDESSSNKPDESSPSRPDESSPNRPDESLPSRPDGSTDDAKNPSLGTGLERPTGSVDIGTDDESKPSGNNPNKPSSGSNRHYGTGRFVSTTAINSIMYESPDPSLKKGIDGEWVLIDQEKHQWRFKFSNGMYAADGWLFIRNPYYNNLDEYSWYHFDDKYMTYGWIKGTGDIWYYGHSVSDGDLGTLVKGWHHDQEDGRDYYLDPITGIMHSGWTYIDSKWYYFAKTVDTFKQNWFWNTEVGRWFYDMLGNRPYGSMYKDEMTPDGYKVNQEGVWDIK